MYNVLMLVRIDPSHVRDLTIVDNIGHLKYHKNTVQKMKFSIKDFFSKKLRIWSHLLKKSLMGNFIFCAMFLWYFKCPILPTIFKSLTWLGPILRSIKTYFSWIVVTQRSANSISFIFLHNLRGIRITLSFVEIL